MSSELERADPWAAIRPFTTARIGLGRAGTGLPTGDMLAFDLACARARDAVGAALDDQRLIDDLRPLECIVVHSAALDRQTYLRRPDLGRRVHPECASELRAAHADLAIIIADGLSSLAVQRHAPSMVREIVHRVPELSLAPVVIAKQARVALSDDVGERLGVKAAVILIGERPGLTAPDSLGIYMTFGPRIGRSDAERNCISNIHGSGLSYAGAAQKLSWLLRESLRRRLSGVELKDEEPNGIDSLPRGNGMLS